MVESERKTCSFCKKSRKYFQQYCDATSIHGIKYLGEERSVTERVWWTIIFVICLTGCSIMIYKIYDKWDRSPVIVSFATKETSIYQIPFPAVTICPETKFDRSIFNYSNIIERIKRNSTLNSDEKKYLKYSSLVCDNFAENSPKTDNENLFSSTEFFNFLEKSKIDFFKHSYNCQFMGEVYSCDELFTPIITDEGVCYSFNILDRSDIFQGIVVHYKNYHKTPNNSKSWSMEQGYFVNAPLDAYPKRALLAGASNALTIHLITDENNLDFKCKEIQGFRVVLHTPMRIPRLKQEFFRIPLNQALVTVVQPVMITTSEAVKAYEPRKRECYFPSERSLKFFKIYSQLNCQLECLTNYTLKLCDCVTIFMPRDRNTSICGTKKFKCLEEAEKKFRIDSLFWELSPNKSQQFDCNCMPICTDLSYNIETSQTNLDWDWNEKLTTINGLKFDRNNVHLSSLTIFFKFNHFITSERNELYGPTDFLANFGGILGLFTGFSILSFTEIVYFLSLRLLCNWRIYGNWNGQEE